MYSTVSPNSVTPPGNTMTHNHQGRNAHGAKTHNGSYLNKKEVHGNIDMHKLQNTGPSNNDFIFNQAGISDVDHDLEEHSDIKAAS